MAIPFLVLAITRPQEQCDLINCTSAQACFHTVILDRFQSIDTFMQSRRKHTFHLSHSYVTVLSANIALLFFLFLEIRIDGDDDDDLFIGSCRRLCALPSEVLCRTAVRAAACAQPQPSANIGPS